MCVLSQKHIEERLVINVNFIREFFHHGATAPSGPDPPHCRGFTITHIDTPQSVGLLWTSDYPDAETFT